MADAEVKIHVGADADTTAIDDASRKVDELKRKSQTASEANPRPAAPPPPSTSVSAGGYEALEKRRQDLLAMRREQRELERLGDTRGARAVERRADRLEKNIDREGARLLKVEEQETRDAARQTAQEAKTRAAEERAASRERREAERHVTREMKEQHAMRRAGVQRAANIYNTAEAAVTGGPGAAASGLVSAAAVMANPAVLVSAIVAAIGVGIANMLDTQGKADKLMQLDLKAESVGYENRRARQSGVFGSSGALIASMVEKEDEIANRKAQRESLTQKTQLGWYNPLRWSDKLFGTKFQADGVSRGDALTAANPLFGLASKKLFPDWAGGTFWKSAAARELQRNEETIRQLEEAKEKDRVEAEKKFLAEEGGQRLRTLRGRSQRTLAGSREALKGEMGERWFDEYKSAKAAGASDGIAQEMSDLSYKNTLRDRQATAGAGLVDAKSGGAGIAAAARWATASIFSDAEAVTELRSLNATVQASNQAMQLVNLAK